MEEGTPWPRTGGAPRLVALVADGRSDGEIATELFLSWKTASVHVAHIKDKLEVDSRVQIALRLADASTVAPP